MIKAKNRKARIKGTPRELTVEIAAAIKTIHDEMLETSPQLADNFKQNIIAIITAPDSPVWTGGVKE